MGKQPFVNMQWTFTIVLLISVRICGLRCLVLPNLLWNYAMFCLISLLLPVSSHVWLSDLFHLFLVTCAFKSCAVPLSLLHCLWNLSLQRLSEPCLLCLTGFCLTVFEPLWLDKRVYGLGASASVLLCCVWLHKIWIITISSYEAGFRQIRFWSRKSTKTLKSKNLFCEVMKRNLRKPQSLWHSWMSVLNVM